MQDARIAWWSYQIPGQAEQTWFMVYIKHYLSHYCVLKAGDFFMNVNSQYGLSCIKVRRVIETQTDYSILKSERLKVIYLNQLILKIIMFTYNCIVSMFVYNCTVTMFVINILYMCVKRNYRYLVFSVKHLRASKDEQGTIQVMLLILLLHVWLPGCCVQPWLTSGQANKYLIEVTKLQSAPKPGIPWKMWIIIIITSLLKHHRGVLST